MFDEMIDIQMVKENNGKVNGKIYLYDEAPEDIENVKIKLIYDELEYSQIAENYFKALSLLRIRLEEMELQILCRGASRNVYPSPMQMNMGTGRNAYVLRINKQAKIDDIVDIFETTLEEECVSLEKQKEFYNIWLKSLDV